jgi:hypothetical protein
VAKVFTQLRCPKWGATREVAADSLYTKAGDGPRLRKLPVCTDAHEGTAPKMAVVGTRAEPTG